MRNRHFQVKLVKDSDVIDAPATAPIYLINTDGLTTEHITYAAKAVVCVLVARKLLNTACEIAVIHAAK